MTNTFSRERSLVRHATPFTESGVWRGVGRGWQPLFGNFRGVGYSIEWHDFFAKHELDWGASFHPDCVELCLNLEGHGYVEGRDDRAEFTPNTAGFYRHQYEPLKARRSANEQHRFLTVEFSCPFLAKHLDGMGAALHPVVCAAIKDCACKQTTGTTAGFPPASSS